MRSGTDRDTLVGRAYRSASALEARQSIYAFAQEPSDFVGEILAMVDWSGVESAVDVGCGNGLYLRRLAGQGFAGRLIGVDLSSTMLAHVRAAWPAEAVIPLLVAGDAVRLPVRSQLADITFAMHMLYHVAEMRQAVGELRRITRANGVVLATTNGRHHLAEIGAVIADALAELGASGKRWAGWVSRFGLDNGAEILGAAFDEVETHERRGNLVIPELAPLIEYVDSMRATEEQALPAGVRWEDFLDAVRRAFRQRLVEAPLRIGTHSGVFVCR